jgi:hypothetical protein
MPQQTDAQLLAAVLAGRQGQPAWWTGPEIESLLTDIILSKANRQDPPTLDPLTIVVGGPQPTDCPAGITEINLPPDYAATAFTPIKRIRIFLGSTDQAVYFKAWQRTPTGFQLTQPGAVTEDGQHYVIENF